MVYRNKAKQINRVAANSVKQIFLRFGTNNFLNNVFSFIFQSYLYAKRRGKKLKNFLHWVILCHSVRVMVHLRRNSVIHQLDSAGV